MNDTEVVTRVIAILTESRKWVEADEDEGVSDDQTLSLVGTLVNELISTSFEVPHNASPQDVASAISEGMSGPLLRAFAGFAAAFHLLAAEHDQHNPEVTSADVLRTLALRVSSEA
ncbi:hypothetical protein [Streptomyces sp. NBC_00338]|uniref:hypothetical protein n=1 Tax=Streptomyces sp. NBC_00338 TaxID=2975715 RepID=UPI002255EB3A|nr:hypothetical protein [Streptomyces sp. NBC_00338]MCX5144643.1 hypothetical protein [Streptomyces sp. NBC_00338]MCX5145061.1 hypothetical protein [Streptomyces sp. NBC_00338]